MKIFTANISKDQSKDTGMAIVLILLLMGSFLDNILFYKIAIPVIIINMIFPPVYKPVAIIWLGMSHLLGAIVSKIVLSIIFFVVVTPIGLIRRFLGYDSLKLKQFKKDTNSVLEIRNIIFTDNEIKKPY